MAFRWLLLLSFITGNLFSQTDEELSKQGVQLIDEEKYELAIPIFNKLIAMDSENTTYRYNRAVALLNLKHYTQALVDYKELSRAVPMESEYPFQVANIYDQLDSLNQAKHYYTKAIELENDNYFFYFKRGTLHLKQSNWNSAIPDFTKALEYNPEHNNSLHNRGIAYYKIGSKEKGCEDWCQALLKGNPRSASHLDRNCKVYPSPCLLSK